MALEYLVRCLCIRKGWEEFTYLVPVVQDIPERNAGGIG